MNKFLQTLFVLLAISSQGNATPTNSITSKAHNSLNANKLLTFNQSNRRSTEQQFKELSADSFFSFSQTLRKNLYSKNIAGLYCISDFEANQIKQPYTEFDLLYKNAIAAQHELHDISERIASQSYAYMLSSGVKDKTRALNKINKALDGNSEKITDLARTSIVAHDIASLIDSFQLIEQEMEIVRIKNRFKTPNASGYRDLSLLVRLPETGLIAEVQLHLEQFSEIKNGKEHKNYEQIQQIQRLQVTEQRALNDIELASIKRLRKESNLMYQQAWNQYLSA
ncbi:MAG: hypothetical protein V7782_13150 [Psychromonas sp.]